MRGNFYVSKPTSFMHLYPDKKSEVTDELLYGTNVTSVDESYAGFLFCKTDYGYSGYVDVSDLSSSGTVDESPKTGDLHPKWFLVMGLGCLGIFLFLKRDKKEKYIVA